MVFYIGKTKKEGKCYSQLTGKINKDGRLKTSTIYSYKREDLKRNRILNCFIQVKNEEEAINIFFKK